MITQPAANIHPKLTYKSNNVTVTYSLFTSVGNGLIYSTELHIKRKPTLTFFNCVYKA